ncbi:hypothetical protein FNV43_RR10793 [Rhamnella rubrinervis]|uniref:Cytochrome P450 n=1 Tax=Rhamnella rubrinervis TaxID=2594499 RepID=A0A8K0H4I5_9ROSA|nr:hypothetical protein FNV43_RR10793 [Rhamnella rubrinervis]
MPEIKTIHLNLHSSATAKPEADHIDHQWPSTIFPHLQLNMIYSALLESSDEEESVRGLSPFFIYSTGSIQVLCITDAEMVKEVGLCTSPNLGKPSYLSKDRGPLLGLGILSTSGSIWAHQRKIIAPELYLDKVKSMVNLMVDSTTSTVESWEVGIKSEGQIAGINVDEDLRRLSADIISRACFGSNFSQGRHIFSKLRTLQKLMTNQTIGVPGSRHMPTKINREIWRLEKEIQSMILEVVKRRVEASYEKDLLQIILEGAKNYGDHVDNNQSLDMTRDKIIVDNWKNIYFAFHETTAITASWSLMLLAANPEWQARARAQLAMVIQETLRLYPPAAFVIREALEEIKLKHIVIPKGVDIQIPISILHQIPSLWGSS